MRNAASELGSGVHGPHVRTKQLPTSGAVGDGTKEPAAVGDEHEDERHGTPPFNETG